MSMCYPPRIPLFFFFSSRRRHTRSLCDWSSDVCSSDLVRGEDAVADVAQRPAGIEVLELVPAGHQAIEPAEQVVPRHDANLEFPGETELLRHRGDRRGAGARIHAPGIRRDLDPALDHGRQDPLHLRDEIRGVAQRRVTRLLLLEDGHRHFGEVVHHEVIDRTTLHLTVWRFQPVSPEPLPGRDAHRRRSRGHRVGTPSAPLPTAMRRADTVPTSVVTRVSINGANPSGFSIAGGFGSRTTARPPATTDNSPGSPTGSSSPRKRIRARPFHEWPGNLAKAG